MAYKVESGKKVERSTTETFMRKQQKRWGRRPMPLTRRPPLINPSPLVVIIWRQPNRITRVIRVPRPLIIEQGGPADGSTGSLVWSNAVTRPRQIPQLVIVNGNELAASRAL